MESRWQDCWLICGQKGSGKSRLARWVWSRASTGQGGVKICVDALRDADPPQAVTFESLDQVPWDSRILRWVPPLTGTREAVERLARLIYQRGAVLVWWDELDQVGDRVTTGPAFKAAILHGRHRQLGQIACTPTLTGNWTGYAKVADHLVLFDSQDPYELDIFARRCGRSLRDIRDAMSGLPPHGYLWYHRRSKTLYEMPALPN